MTRTATFRPQALVDIDGHVAEIAGHSPRTARRFYDAMEAGLELLCRFPDLGPPCEFHHPSAKGLRLWILRGFKNHIVFYRPTASVIEVIRVIHGSRDLDALFDSGEIA